MKKILIVLISLLVVLTVAGCSSSSGSMSGVSEDENTYVVTFENASKDMTVSTEMTLEENQVINFNHELEIDDLVKVDFIDAEGLSAMDLELKDFGGGQTILQPGTYTVEVKVLEKANGKLTLSIGQITGSDTENPWKVAEDMQEALDATGISFIAPIPEALPDGVTYRYSFYNTEDGIFQVNYGNDTDELFFRISKNHAGKEDLAGDYNEYATSWNEPVKGLDVTCYGDDTDNIRLATFTSGDQNYSINYNAYTDGPGMSVNELNSLLNGMQ